MCKPSPQFSSNPHISIWLSSQSNCGIRMCHFLHDNGGLGDPNSKNRVSKGYESPKLVLDNQVQATLCFLRLSALLILIVKIKAHERYLVFIALWACSFWKSYSLKAADGHPASAQGWVGKTVSSIHLAVVSYTCLVLKAFFFSSFNWPLCNSPRLNLPPFMEFPN